MVLRARLREIMESILHLFYPRLCEGCQAPLLAQEAVLCISCMRQLPETNYHQIPDNDTALRFSGRVPFSNATSFAWFTTDGLLQHLVHGLKYQGKKETGYFLGRKLGERIATTTWAGELTVVTPVPLHPAKQAVRGYNQSLLIARGIADVLGVPVSEQLLQRVRKTESQTRKTRAERVKNMENAFSINTKELKGDIHVLLVDDVLTTGATLEACAQTLLADSRIKISFATLGIAIS